MKVQELIQELGCDFYTGVPDSQLKELCNFLMEEKGISAQHIIAANEGNAVGLAAGYHLSTGKIPVVYMQNSGIGNVINPMASLLNPKVYGIPCIFIIGWRGEPGVHDEPQHIFQGEVTTRLLDVMEIAYFVIGTDSTIEEIREKMKCFTKLLEQGKSVAFIVRKKGLEGSGKPIYENKNTLVREAVIEEIVKVAEDDVIVSTTGKASRELFEIREKRKEGHEHDFLTVGSMGHSSSIALEIAENKRETKVWCIDGDGAVLMHMGAMALMGTRAPHNLVHIVINNEAHETVGGMPTVANQVDFAKIAEGCGYEKIWKLYDMDTLQEALKEAKEAKKLCFLEIKCCISSRTDLGRPTTTASANKEHFMAYLRSCS